jgi:glycosyltransferase involved in cell wall biosynthesis
MRLSIIIPFLNSHEIVRRQILNFRNMSLPSDVEIIFVDDGSSPALTNNIELRNFQIHATHDYRPWTWALARNSGARLAKGKYLFLIDGDYILRPAAIERALEFNEDRLGTVREFGILDEDGNFSQDHDTLIAYGLPPERIAAKGVKLPPHQNDFVINTDLFWRMGGYREDLCELPYPQGEDRKFKKKLLQWERAGKLHLTPEGRPLIYHFPNGQFCGDVDFNPHGLFHNLTRKTENNHWFKHPRYTYASS